VFGKNEIVGKKYFRDADKQQMFVTSMFMTLQGEGPYRGMPAFFIRLAKCNLACSFCDTFFDDGDWLTFDEIEERIETTIDEFYKGIEMDRPDWTRSVSESQAMERAREEAELLAGGLPFTLDSVNATYLEALKKKKRMVLVMTGGEPMLQDNIGPFLERMAGIFENTQIESNGTQNTAIPESTTLVISPKCAEKKDPISGEMVATKYLTPRKEVLERATCLKFVMDSDQDSPYSVVPDWAHEWAQVFGREVFVSPMNNYNDIPAMSKKQRALNNGISLEERSTVDEVISFWEPGLLNMEMNQKNHEYAARYCVTHGFILNLQLHLYASLA
jgi:7-carboxy-7-deazaguanine synthase